MAEESITHAQALDLIEEHIGEEVYVGFLFAPPDGSKGDFLGVEETIGVLANPFGDERPPRLEPDIGAYELGPNRFYLSPMAGTVCMRDNGIDFRPSDNALIRIAWRGSREVGDWRPTRETLTKLNELGITMPEHQKPGVILAGESPSNSPTLSFDRPNHREGGASVQGREPRRVDKPWGHEIWWAQTPEYAAKILVVKAGQALSLQFHREKDESSYLFSGRLRLTTGATEDDLEEQTVGPGESWQIEPGGIHSIEALEDSVVFEVSTPQLDDVVRLKDRYGRS